MAVVEFFVAATNVENAKKASACHGEISNRRNRSGFRHRTGPEVETNESRTEPHVQVVLEVRVWLLPERLRTLRQTTDATAVTVLKSRDSTIRDTVLRRGDTLLALG